VLYVGEGGGCYTDWKGRGSTYPTVLQAFAGRAGGEGIRVGGRRGYTQARAGCYTRKEGGRCSTVLPAVEGRIGGDWPDMGCTEIFVGCLQSYNRHLRLWPMWPCVG
jgi:hypothetical protein